MNADYDIEHIGVQAIILVENSIRYISSYLPNIYKIVLLQSLDFQREALNEHQRMLKMRAGRKSFWRTISTMLLTFIKNISIMFWALFRI